ncbi:MAG: type II toxin-antitoxin system VapC family toxin [Candidatus Binatia bacterium]
MCSCGSAWNRSEFRARRQAVSSGGVGIASISLWEIAMLIARGRLSPRGTPEAWIAELVETSGIVVKELTPVVAVLSTQFPNGFSADPADRLIAATARAEGLALVTRNANIRRSSLVKTIW